VSGPVVVLLAAAVLSSLYLVSRLVGRARKRARAAAAVETGPAWWKVGGDEWLLEDVDSTVDQLVLRVAALERERSAPDSSTPPPTEARADDVEDVRRAVGELRDRLTRLERRLEEVERWPGDQA
jgi:ubiquinone biosynthesis protein UbiJ